MPEEPREVAGPRRWPHVIPPLTALGRQIRTQSLRSVTGVLAEPGVRESAMGQKKR